MRLSQNIQQHKDGLVLMVQMPEPSIVCNSDDDYIDYARYCWSAIGEIKNTYADVNCYKEEFYLNTGAIKRDIRTAQKIIKLCYLYLSNAKESIAKPTKNVYTGKLSQGKR